MLNTFIVYDGGRQEHPDSILVELEAQTWYFSARKWPDHPSQHVIISDAVAQTIASWHHSPAEPYSTLLSTRGQVDRYTTLDHFGDPGTAETEMDAWCLQALGAYIASKITGAPSGARSCACNGCFDVIVGIPGDVCVECADWGCDPTDSQSECQVMRDTCPNCGAHDECDCSTSWGTD